MANAKAQCCGHVDEGEDEDEDDEEDPAGLSSRHRLAADAKSAIWFAARKDTTSAWLDGVPVSHALSRRQLASVPIGRGS